MLNLYLTYTFHENKMAHIQMSIPTTQSIDVTANIHEHFVSQNKFNDCSALINCVHQRATLIKIIIINAKFFM